MRAQREQDERERRLRTRELQAYARETLALEDRGKLVEDIVSVQLGMTEDDIDDLIEKSKVAYTKVRKQVIAELRAQGWKSPRDLARLAAEGRDVDDDVDEDEPEVTAPQTRDRRDSGGLSKKRRQSLRDRFRYGGKV